MIVSLISLFLRVLRASSCPSCNRFGRSASLADRQLPLHPQAITRHGEAESEVDEGDEDVAFDLERSPVRIRVDRELHAARELEEAHDGDERRVLEDADEGIH